MITTLAGTGAALLLVLGFILFGVAMGLVLARTVIGLQGGRVAVVALTGAGAGAILGLGAGVFAFRHFHAQQDEARKGWNLRPIVVAAADLKAGEPITFDLISQRSIPEQFVTDDIVLPDQASRLVNLSTAAEVKQGDPMLWGLTCLTRPPARTP